MSDLTNKNYRLQFLNHEDVFDTREDALEYIDEYLKPDVLLAEPAVVFYGNKKSPNAILAIGSVANKKVFTVDLTKIEEDLGEVKDNAEKSLKKVDKAVKTIKSIINTCGLILDENKINDQVVYIPDAEDAIIGKAKTLADAIDILSKYAQKINGNTKFSVADTNSVKLTFKENEDGEKTLKAKVKVSDSGDSDEKDFNNNILGIKSDGLYAAVHLEYDDLRNELTFYTSGMKDGRFHDDAKRQVINLGKHTKVTTDNNDHNVKLTIDSENVISGDVKIDESREYNILKSSDGGIYVEGKAKNIKYKDTNVLDALSNVEEKLAEFKLEVNKNKNILKLTIGDKTEKVELPGVDFIDDAKYDPSSKSIIIKFKNGNQIFIPVDDMIAENSYKIAHNNTTVGDKFDKLDEELDELEKANLKTVQDLIGEINERKNQAESILAKIEQEINDREHADEDIKHLIEDVKKELDITEIKEELKKFEEGYAKFEGEWEVYKDQIKKAISDAEAVSVHVSNLEQDLAVTNANLSHLTDSVAKAEGNIIDNASKIADNTLAIEKVSDNVTSLGTKVDGHIANYDTLNKSVSDLTNTVGNLETKVNGIDSTVSQHTSDIKSNNQTINDEIARAKEKEGEIDGKIDKEFTRATGEEARLEERINTNEKAISQNKSDIGVISTSIGNLRSEFNTERERAKNEDASLKEQIDNTFNKSKEYTDAKVLKAKDEAIAESKDFADNALSEAKEYSDKNLAEEVDRAKDAEKTNAVAIVKLQEKDTEIEANVNKKIEKVTLERAADDSLEYILKVDDKDTSRIKLPEVQILKSAEYLDDIKVIRLIFITEDNKETTTDINVSDLVDTYEPGDGLDLNGNAFSIKLDRHSEDYLTVSEQGLSLNGVKAALDEKANTQDISNLVKTVKFNLDKETDERKTADEGLDAKITEKANASEVYKIETADFKFLSKDDAKSTYAPKFTVENSDTIELHMSDEKVLKSVLHINNTDGLNNALLFNGNGAYVNVSLTYDEVTNTLTFNTGIGQPTKIKLTGATVITGGYYDAKEKIIVLEVAGGDKIQIPVTDLVGQLTAVNPLDDPVHLEIDYNEEGGKNTIQATLNISTEPTNLILNKNGTLYASKQAESMTADWGEVVNKNLQSIITILKDRTDGIEVLKSDVDGLKTDMNEAKINITNIQDQLTNLEDSVDTLTNTVNDLKGRVTVVEGDIKKLQDMLGSDPGSSDTVFDRLAKIEKFIEDFVDFGDY